MRKILKAITFIMIAVMMFTFGVSLDFTGKTPLIQFGQKALAISVNPTIAAGFASPNEDLTRLSNGWLVCAVQTSYDTVTFYKSIDNGQTWFQLCYTQSISRLGQIAIANNGTFICCLCGGNTLNCFTFDATTVQNVGLPVGSPYQLQYDRGSRSISLTVDSSGNFHVAWASASSDESSLSVGNCVNMHYAKGDYNSSYGISWEPPIQVTNSWDTGGNYSNDYSSLIIKNNQPVVFYIYNDYGNCSLCCYTRSGGSKYVTGSSTQLTKVSAAVSPDGTVNVVYLAGGNIMYVKSTDLVNWSTPINLTNITNYMYFASNPVIYSDSSNDLTVMWSAIDSNISTTVQNIRKIVFNNNAWGAITTVTNSASTNLLMSSFCKNSNVGSIFKQPPFIYNEGNGTYNGSNVKFKGEVNISPQISITSSTNYTYSTQSGKNTIPISGTINDPDLGDSETIYYRIDGTTGQAGTQLGSTITSNNSNQPFSGSIDVSNLTEGTHTLYVWVQDNIGSKSAETQILFKFDKTAPTLGSVSVSSSFNSITLSGTATDSIAGLDPYPYRYTIGTISTDWLNVFSNTWNGLIPNTQYSVKFEARDAIGFISNNTLSINTKAQQPTLTTNNPSSYTLDLSTNDLNPLITQYQVSVNNGTSYITSEGKLTSGSTWMTFPAGKKITVTGLTPNTTYNFSIKAKNAEGIETVTSTASGTTLVAPPGSPTNIVATANNNSITVAWDPVTNATGYDLEADGVVKDAGNNTSYTVTGLTQNTQHTYRVRSKGAGGQGEWSAPITKSTLPNAPGVPINIITAPASTSITVVWDSVGGATSYDIEVDGDIVNNGPTTNYTHRGIAPGTHHTYRVRSINPGGKSEWSQIVNASTTVETPTVPANLKAVPTHAEIVLSWDAIAGATYDIEVDGAVIDTGTRTSYTHAGLTSGTEHMYRVRSKKNGSTGEWSAALKVSTLPNEFGTPANIQTTAGDTSISISWDAVSSATGYEVEADGSVVDNGAENIFVMNGLLPNTNHTYRVRTKNDTQTSEWSNPASVNTYLLPVPGGITAISSDNSIALSWNAVNSAECYDIEVDGLITENITSLTYTSSNLKANTQHSFRIRAKSSSGTSAWSIPIMKSTLFNGDNTPSNLTAVTKNTSITLMWSGVQGASGYDVEADGAIISNLITTTYKQTGLTPGAQHTYRVRAKNGSGDGAWGKALTVSSLPNGPAIPSNLTGSANTTSIRLTWDEAENATQYEVEVDGIVISTGSSSSYLHAGLNPNSSHTYRVRSKNVNGTSPWSSLLTVRTKASTENYSVECVSGEEFNLVFNSNGIDTPNGYTYTITYNTNELEVLDLCSTTAKSDLTTGNVAGTDIKIIQAVPGTIVFIKTGVISLGDTWSGFVNSIKFKSKVEGQATVTYSIN